MTNTKAHSRKRAKSIELLKDRAQVGSNHRITSWELLAKIAKANALAVDRDGRSYARDRFPTFLFFVVYLVFSSLALIFFKLTIPGPNALVQAHLTSFILTLLALRWISVSMPEAAQGIALRPLLLSKLKGCIVFGIILIGVVGLSSVLAAPSVEKEFQSLEAILSLGMLMLGLALFSRQSILFNASVRRLSEALVQGAVIVIVYILFQISYSTDVHLKFNNAVSVVTNLLSCQEKLSCSSSKDSTTIEARNGAFKIIPKGEFATIVWTRKSYWPPNRTGASYSIGMLSTYQVDTDASPIGDMLTLIPTVASQRSVSIPKALFQGKPGEKILMIADELAEAATFDSSLQKKKDPFTGFDSEKIKSFRVNGVQVVDVSKAQLASSLF